MENHRPEIGFLLGKPPRKGTLFPNLFERLTARGLRVTLSLPHEDDGAVTGVTPRPALVVHRGLRRDVLERLDPLEQAGWRFCTPVASSLAVLDRARLAEKLRAAGLPAPRSFRLTDWHADRLRATGSATVVKSIDGGKGSGAGVWFAGTGEWPEHPPFAGPWLVEERIPNDGADRKLSVAGAVCRGLMKPWPRQDDAAAVPFEPDAGLVDLAHATGAALGIEIFGVDVVIGPDGPVIVDVNLFPGFRGVDGAAALIADHLARRVAAECG